LYCKKNKDMKRYRTATATQV